MVYLASGNVFMFAGLLLSPRTFVILWPLCFGLVFRVISFYPLLYFIHDLKIYLRSFFFKHSDYIKNEGYMVEYLVVRYSFFDFLDVFLF